MGSQPGVDAPRLDLGCGVMGVGLLAVRTQSHPGTSDNPHAFTMGCIVLYAAGEQAAGGARNHVHVCLSSTID